MAMRKKLPQTYCKSCEEVVPSEICPICRKLIKHACLDCHKEIAHDTVVNQNIHVCGGYTSKLNSIDGDPDAFGKAGK
jgi:predicted amidophosphoribosyltransferase